MKITLIPDSLSTLSRRPDHETNAKDSIFALNWAGTAGKPTRNLLGTSRGIAKKRGASLRNDFGWSNGVPLGSMSIAFWQLENCFPPCAQYWKIAFLRLEMHFYCDCAVSTGRMSVVEGELRSFNYFRELGGSFHLNFAQNRDQIELLKRSDYHSVGKGVQ